MGKFEELYDKYVGAPKEIISEELTISDKNKVVDMADNFIEVVTAKIIQDGRSKNSTSEGYEVKVKDNVLTIQDPSKIGDITVNIKNIIEVGSKIIEINDVNAVTSVMAAIHSQIRSLNNKVEEKPVAPVEVPPEAKVEPTEIK